MRGAGLGVRHGRGGPRRRGRRAGSAASVYTQSPLQDSRLFGPRPWKILATTYETNGFLSNPDPGENLVRRNLVMETGCNSRKRSLLLHSALSYSILLYYIMLLYITLCSIPFYSIILLYYTALLRARPDRRSRS